MKIMKDKEEKVLLLRSASRAKAWWWFDGQRKLSGMVENEGILSLISECVRDCMLVIIYDKTSFLQTISKVIFDYQAKRTLPLSFHGLKSLKH
jgi:hypothetical protein